jgi:hypothetical protein
MTPKAMSCQRKRLPTDLPALSVLDIFYGRLIAQRAAQIFFEANVALKVREDNPQKAIFFE